VGVSDRRRRTHRLLRYFAPLTVKSPIPLQARPGYAFVNFVDGPADGLREQVRLPLPQVVAYWLAGMSEAEIDDPSVVSKPVHLTHYCLRRRIHPDGRLEWVYSIHGPRT
jgi:hypothetical protein